MPIPLHVRGNLLDQPVDVIVNAWNRNVFPWWLLVPQGVSAAIRKCAGTEPFRELAKMPWIPLGGAVMTGAGKLPYKAIVHVAGINLLWFATEQSIRLSVLNALALCETHRFRSIAFPLIGAGTGGRNEARVQAILTDTIVQSSYQGEVRVVSFTRSNYPSL